MNSNESKTMGIERQNEKIEEKKTIILLKRYLTVSREHMFKPRNFMTFWSYQIAFNMAT